MLVAPTHTTANCNKLMPTTLLSNMVIASFCDFKNFGAASSSIGGSNGRAFLIQGDGMIEVQQVRPRSLCSSAFIVKWKLWRCSAPLKATSAVNRSAHIPKPALLAGLSAQARALTHVLNLPFLGCDFLGGGICLIPQFVMSNERNAGTHLWAASAAASGSLRIRNTVMNYTASDDVIVHLEGNL